MQPERQEALHLRGSYADRYPVIATTTGTKPRVVAAVGVLVVLVGTGLVDAFAREAHRAEVRVVIAGSVDAMARDLSDLVARETASVETLAAFVEIDDGDLDRLESDFPVFADALMRQTRTIRSVQLAPDAILHFVYPVEGNEEAVGLDLLADPDRRALIEPAIETGATLIQGPVELVQGGVGLIVRRPVYLPNGGYWGVASVVLDWSALSAEVGFESADGTISAVRMPDRSRILAGNPTAFDGEPVLSTLRVGGTDTTWELAMRPSDGWPGRAPLTPVVWMVGAVVALIAAVATHGLVARPEALRRERQRALDELALADARHQAMFQHSGVGMVITDLRGRIVSMNRSFREITGLLEDEEVEGRRVQRYVHPDDRRRYLSLMSLVVDTGEHCESEVRLNGGAGERWCRTSVSLIPGGASDEGLLVGIVDDVTLRRRSEQALAESEARFRQLFEQAPIAIQREDHSQAERSLRELAASGIEDLRRHLQTEPEVLARLLGSIVVTDANPAAERLQRSLGSRAKGSTLLDRLNEESREAFIDTLMAIASGSDGLELSVQSRAVDGTPVSLDVRWHAPTVDGARDYRRMMVTISDVTELRETQRRLEDLLASKDRFLASVAHELRTPLTAVVGFAQELRDPAGIYGSSERDEFRDLIAFHSTELAHLIEDLLVWARGDIGEVRISIERVDLGAVVRQTLRALPGVEIPVFEPDGRITALGDPTRVRQIVRNLATNAMRYGGDHVEVAVRRLDGVAVVEVSDDGRPMSPADMSRIFEPYERSAAFVGQPGSIGLGLTVSRSLARLQGGDVLFVRESERNVFRVMLPDAAVARSLTA